MFDRSPAGGLGLEFGFDGEPGLGGVGGELIRIIAGNFAKQRDIPAQRYTDDGIPFIAISNAKPRRSEIMVDQPENSPFQRTVAAQLIAKISIYIPQAIGRRDEKFVRPAVKGMKRRKRCLQRRTAIAFETLKSDFRGYGSRNQTGFCQHVIMAKDRRIGTIFLLTGIFCSLEYFHALVEWLIAG